MNKIQKRRLRAGKRLHAKIVRFAKSRTKCPELRAIAIIAAGNASFNVNVDVARTATVRSLFRFVHDEVLRDIKKVGAIPGCSWPAKRAKHLVKLRHVTGVLRIPVKYDDFFYN